MNNDRRKEIARITAMVEEALELIQAVEAEEQEAYDNLPPSMQDAERGDAMMNAIGDLGDAAADLETAVERLTSAAA